jgi:hypothetical protein
MLSKTIPRKVIRLKAPAAGLTSDIEYRVVWNQTHAQWEIHRNGAKTSNARRKKQSAVDLAISAIQAEVRPPEAKLIVTSLKDKTLKTEWVGPVPVRVSLV